VVYQPQVDGWNAFQSLTGRCAFALTTARGGEPQYGTFRFVTETLVDAERKIVLMRNVRASDVRFSSAPGGRSAEWAELIRQLLPTEALVVSLDRVLAFVRTGEMPRKEAKVRTEAPAIFVSTQPAALVIVDGDPLTADVANTILPNTTLRQVVNTNWDLYQDRRTNRYYLRMGKGWLRASDLHDTFVAATEIPADLAQIPAANRTEGVPDTSGPVKVIVVQKPSELIVIRGTPVLEGGRGAEKAALPAPYARTLSLDVVPAAPAATGAVLR